MFSKAELINVLMNKQKVLGGKSTSALCAGSESPALPAPCQDTATTPQSSLPSLKGFPAQKTVKEN